MPRFKLGSLRPKLMGGTALNAAGAAGTRRFVIIGGIGVTITALLIAATCYSTVPSQDSYVGKLPAMSPLPGGSKSTPLQDNIARRDAQERAQRALETGESFTPALPSSHPVKASQYGPPPDDPPVVAPASPPPSPPPAQITRPVPAAPAVRTAPFPAPAIRPAVDVRAEQSPPPVTRAADRTTQPRDPKAEEDYRRAVNDLLAGWGGRPPRTEIVLQPQPDVGADNRAVAGPAANQAGVPVTQIAATGPMAKLAGNAERVLVPAGRGIYAHTVLAANSDAPSPVVLQADSGPIAGDRMLGSFTREDERLVIRVAKVIHNGEEISVDGIVVAP